MKAIAIALAVTQACAISLKVTSGDGNASSPYLYGAMFEVFLDATHCQRASCRTAAQMQK